MNPDLYEFLPSIYRELDERLAFPTDAVPPLKSLFAVLQLVYDGVETEIEDLYGDWFIETCSPDMFPAFAEMLGIDRFLELSRSGVNMRGLLANVVSYRQRKGTIRGLRDIARAVTGWTVNVVDNLSITAGTIRMNEPAFDSFISVRKSSEYLAAIVPERIAADVRYNISGLRAVRLEVWRRTAAYTVGVQPGTPTADARRGTFSSLGNDKALMRPAEATADGGNVAYFVPFTRSDARRELYGDGLLRSLTIYAANDKRKQGMKIRIADLASWEPGDAPGSDIFYVDPELGRILAPDDVSNYRVDSYMETYNGLGAGVASRPWPSTFDRSVWVTGSDADVAGEVASIRSALDALATNEGRIRIVLGDSKTHRDESGAGWTIALPDSCTEFSLESAPGTRPTIVGKLTFIGSSEQKAVVHLRGLNIAGLIVVRGNVAVEVDAVTMFGRDDSARGVAFDLRNVRHTTGNDVSICNSIVDGMVLNDGLQASIDTSIVMGAIVSQPAADAASAQGGLLVVERCSLFAPVDVIRLRASDSIFDTPISVAATHDEYLRYCAIRPGSRVPRQFKCVTATRQLFASRRYGRLTFGSLREDASDDILRGASNGSEMGAFNRYAFPHRDVSLRRIMEEYIPAGVGNEVVYRS